MGKETHFAQNGSEFEVQNEQFSR